MASFLTTPKMSPELAARIEARLRGRQRLPAGKMFGPRIPISVLLPVVAVVAVIGIATLSRWFARREVEHARKELLDRVREGRASMPPETSTFLPKVEAWITQLAGHYEGDLIAEQLRVPQALQTQVAREGLYLHGSLSKLAVADQLADAASASVKDSFLLCLVDPPESRTDKALLKKVRGANFAAAAPQVRRLYEAEAGLSVLQPAWETRVRTTQEPKILASLNRDFSRAPIADARRLTKAEVLFVVIDELPEGTNSSEADRPHEVRVGMVDLRSQAVLLRLRRRVEPPLIPDATRAAHGRAISGCVAAMEVQEAVRN